MGVAAGRLSAPAPAQGQRPRWRRNGANLARACIRFAAVRRPLDFLPMPTAHRPWRSAPLSLHYLDTSPMPIRCWSGACAGASCTTGGTLCLLHRDYRTGNYLASEQESSRTRLGSPARAPLRGPRLGSPPAVALHRSRPRGRRYRPTGELPVPHEVSPLRIERSQLHYWQVMATLRWAVIATAASQRYLSGEAVHELTQPHDCCRSTELDILHMTGAEAP